MSPRRALIVAAAALVTTLATAAAAEAPSMSALHDALRLTAGQESAWTTYEALIPPPAQARARHRAAAMLFPTLSAPRRIDLVEAEMKEDLADVHRQSQALKSFYATLTPDQQRIFDTMTLPSEGSDDDRR